MKEVVIIGGSGHAKVIADIIVKSGDRIVGFLDDNVHLPHIIMGNKYLGVISDYVKYTDCFFIVGIGNAFERKRIVDTINVKWYTAIHPSAQIANDTIIGEGCAIMANAVINPSTKIGDHCIINTGAVIEHDNNLGDYVHVSPNATLCGNVTVGRLSHVGAGATIINNISIPPETIIGAGAVIVKNIDVKGTYVGIPAKMI